MSVETGPTAVASGPAVYHGSDELAFEMYVEKAKEENTLALGEAATAAAAAAVADYVHRRVALIVVAEPLGTVNGQAVDCILEKWRQATTRREALAVVTVNGVRTPATHGMATDAIRGNKIDDAMMVTTVDAEMIGAIWGNRIDAKRINATIRNKVDDVMMVMNVD